MASADRNPNIVLIVLDTHRRDRLGCYGCPRGTSPNLDAFAEEATVFENGIAPAQWTIPSHASMFSGEPPSVHMALQSGDVLHPRFTTLAEHLSDHGYRTVGFCNNPLVGVLDNGLKRGFDTFYNYCGAFPSGRDAGSVGVLGGLRRLSELALHSLRRISRPIENAFAGSSSLFQGALDPFWVPIWTWVANFKGKTPRSIRDVARYVDHEMRSTNDQPRFVFVNLMETHLPYSPPDGYVETFVPSYREVEARGFLRGFNRRAGDWFTPPEEPFSDVEARALAQMYDAEVAYQDHLLGELLQVLDRPVHRDHTMVVVVADHGEMLGEHQLMGHAFGVFQELVHVPLLMRLPGQTRGRRVSAPVSTTRLFHTLLDVAGLAVYETADADPVEVRELSLTEVARGGDEPEAVVYSEAYAPEFALQVMEARKPALIERLHCRATQRAAYEGSYKLISIENIDDRLFSLGPDFLEKPDVDNDEDEGRKRRLRGHLKSFLERARARRVDRQNRQRAANLDDVIVQQRLRDLGYIE
jgi:uncharacterized sulfatase